MSKSTERDDNGRSLTGLHLGPRPPGGPRNSAVWKYEISFVKLDDDSILTLEMPHGALPLSVQVQGHTRCLWALVDPSAPLEPRRFRVAGTGHPIEQESLRYVATWLERGGSLVWHLFELPPG